MNKPTIGLLDFIFMVLVTVTGLYLSTKLPILGIFCLSIGGIPAFILSISRNNWFLFYLILTFVTSWSLTSFTGAFLLLPLVFMPALFLAGALRLGFHPLKAVGVALLSATLFSAGTWAATNEMTFSGSKAISLKQNIGEQLKLVEKQLDEAEEKNPENFEAINIARKNIYNIYEYAMLLIPVTFLFAWHAITILIYYAGATRLSAKLGYKLAELPPFTEWQFNWQIIWLYMVGILFYHALSGVDWGAIGWLIKMVSANCLAISSMVYYLAGLSLLFFMLNKYRAGFYTRFIMSFLALFFAQAVVWFGIIDIWADFRNPKPASVLSDSDE
jgi:hypothetical protein